MTTTARDAIPDKGFLRRITLASSWGEGLDGFDLGVISVVLVSITPDLGMGPVMAGFVGASSLQKIKGNV